MKIKFIIVGFSIYLLLLSLTAPLMALPCPPPACPPCHHWVSTGPGPSDGYCEYDCSATETCCLNGDCCDNYSGTCCYGIECCHWTEGEVCCWGTCCDPACCDSWGCQHCVGAYCQPCLRKVSTYAQLQQCSNVADDPNTSPLQNGCTLSPDNPAGCENTSFLGPCNQHDMCYQTCNNSKGGCDNVFLNALTAVCAGVPPGECYDDCIDWASWYVWAVEEYGDDAYEDDQVAACTCCDC